MKKEIPITIASTLLVIFICSIIGLLCVRNVVLDKFIDNIVLAKCVTEEYKFTDNKKIKFVNLKTQDDKADIWLSYIKNATTQTAILYSHGALNHMGYNEDLYEQFKDHCTFIMYDYRGYGKSSGVSTEESIQNDVMTVYNYVVNKLDILPQNLILYGKSLGVYPTLFLANAAHGSNRLKLSVKAEIVFFIGHPF